jgi:hypothetical protein
MRVFAILVCLLLTSCNDGDVYTLYRDSVVMPNQRLHVATFDSADGRDYNKENCAAAQELFQNQSGAGTKFWCELGKYKK